jgi:16S rRNA (cytidine1402-2'-O)-methyltransferase
LLVLVGTPIGNIGDISHRAQDCLNKSEIIVAEDTRRTRELFNHLNISIAGKRFISLFKDNEENKIKDILKLAVNGHDITYVTDAGMPVISDPGAKLVNAFIKEDIKVICLPGPSAVTCALALSGFVADRFCFEGFLPKAANQREIRIKEILSRSMPTVIFESPKRISRLMKEFMAFDDGAQFCVSRELTKLHEESIYGTASQIYESLSGRALGEFTIVVCPKRKNSSVISEDLFSKIESTVKILNKSGISNKLKAELLHELTGISKNKSYEIITKFGA